LGGQILTLNGFVNPYSQVKWIFSTKMAQRKALILFKLNSHAKMAPDTLRRLGVTRRQLLEQVDRPALKAPPSKHAPLALTLKG
jgi:hypothetical protein